MGSSGSGAAALTSVRWRSSDSCRDLNPAVPIARHQERRADPKSGLRERRRRAGAARVMQPACDRLRGRGHDSRSFAASPPNPQALHEEWHDEGWRSRIAVLGLPSRPMVEDTRRHKNRDHRNAETGPRRRAVSAVLTGRLQRDCGGRDPAARVSSSARRVT